MSCCFFCLISMPFGPTVGWIRGHGFFPGETGVVELAVGPISLCHIEGSGEDTTSTCMHRGELCSLNETAFYCKALKDSTLSMGLMWGAFGLHLVQAGCAIYMIQRCMRLRGFSATITAIVIVVLLPVMMGLQIWAVVGEEQAMQPVYDSNLLSKPHADVGRVCAYISCCLIFLQIISSYTVCILSLVNKHNKAKKRNKEVQEDTPLSATAGGGTTPDSESSYQPPSISSDANPVYQPAIYDGYQPSSDGLPSYHA